MSAIRIALTAGVIFFVSLGMLFNPLDVGTGWGISSTFVISQFQVAGATAADEFIEIHNVSGRALDLEGYKLVYRTDGSTSDTLMYTFPSLVVPAGGYYLLANAGYDGAVPRDATYVSALSAAGGGIGLRDPGNVLADSVGYGSGSNTFTETAKTSVPSSNQSRVRDNQGCMDGDNNLADFFLLNPAAPRNAASSVALCVPLDLAPTVASTIPVDGAVDVAVDADITLQFSEPVSFGAEDSFAISCDGSLQPAIAGGGPVSYILDPIANLPNGLACTVTILAGGVTDLDGWPDVMVEDYTMAFTVAPVDDPPLVNATDPAESATGVLLDAVISIDFSEPVSLVPGFAQILCASGEHAYSVDGSGNPHILLDPVVDFSWGDTCTVTIHGDQVTDLDGSPDVISVDHSWSFSTLYDQAPSVTCTSPVENETGVDLDHAIVVSFSEPVDLDSGWISLSCSRSGDHPLTVVSAVGESPVELEPLGEFLFEEVCTISILPNNVHDQDDRDPYDMMLSAVIWSYETRLPAFWAFIGFITTAVAAP